MSAREDLPAPGIRLRGLEKTFRTRRALASIDLEISGHQIVGVVGPDGAGKTTLLRAIAGLLEVRAREATVLGHDLGGDVRALKGALGYVPQRFSLHHELSVIENLRFTARVHRLSEPELEARARPLLARTGLAPFASRPASALSGGMKQKLALVNALLPEPRLLVLDEPTAGIDVAAREEIWALLAARRDAILIVVSTSYLEEAAACDRLLYLDRGRVVATGTPAELREHVGLELYRAWGQRPRAIARAAGALPYVAGTHAAGGYARVEIPHGRSPGEAQVLRDLSALPEVPVQLVERVPVDMEATLLALARGAA